MSILTAVLGIFNESVIQHDSDDEIIIPLDFEVATLDVLPYDEGDRVWFDTPGGEMYVGKCIEIVEVEADDCALWAFVVYELMPKRMATAFMPIGEFMAVQ